MPDKLFVNVILPLALPRLLTYSVPDELIAAVAPGKRVVVQLGKQKIYSAIIRSVHSTDPGYPLKDIHSVLDEQPVVTEKQFQLWEWMASYYLCHTGEVMSSALPSALKLHSETKIMLNGDYDHEHA